MGGPSAGFMDWVRTSDTGGPVQLARTHDDRASFKSHERFSLAERGSCCRCGQDFSAKAPRVDTRELFVNVTIRSIEDNPVKQVQSWMGGVLGQVMGGGKNHFSYLISMNHFQENELGIKAEIQKVFLNRGWHIDISTMLLPPSRGQNQPSSYIQITRDELPIFMVLRVKLKERYWQHSWDCSEILPFYRPIDKSEYEDIGKELEHALMQQQFLRNLRRPIRAEISVVDAAGEMHALYNMHWSEEQAADCILRSRKQTSDSANQRQQSGALAQGHSQQSAARAADGVARSPAHRQQSAAMAQKYQSYPQPAELYQTHSAERFAERTAVSPSRRQLSPHRQNTDWDRQPQQSPYHGPAAHGLAQSTHLLGDNDLHRQGTDWDRRSQQSPYHAPGAHILLEGRQMHGEDELHRHGTDWDRHHQQSPYHGLAAHSHSQGRQILHEDEMYGVELNQGYMHQANGGSPHVYDWA